MSDNLAKHSSKQEAIARAALPRLAELADELEKVTWDVFEKRVSYAPSDGGDVMALSFVTKQREHLRSVRALIAIDAHRDALLIARTMLEGLGRLLWAFNKVPERTDLWFWFGAILDWRQTLRNEEAGVEVDPEERAELRSYVDRYGSDYYRQKVRTAIQQAEDSGTDYTVPDDPWNRDWTVTSVDSMFSEVGGKELYDRIYRDTSEWVHWGPRAILRAAQAVDWGTAGFTDTDWRAAAVAMQTGCQALLQSLQILDGHFSLGLSQRLEELHQQMDTALSESIADGVQ